MKPIVQIDLRRFTAHELMWLMAGIVLLILSLTICVILAMTCVVGIWRPMRLEVIGHVFDLLKQVFALVAAVVGGVFGMFMGMKATTPAPQPNIETPLLPPSLDVSGNTE